MSEKESKARIAAAVSMLFQSFRKTADFDAVHDEANKNLAKLYMRLLSKLPADRVEAAVMECIYSCEFFPPVAAIVKRAQPESNWRAVRNEIARGLRSGQTTGWSADAKMLIEHIGLRTLQYSTDNQMQNHWKRLEELYEKHRNESYLKDLTNSALGNRIEGGIGNGKYISE